MGNMINGTRLYWRRYHVNRGGISDMRGPKPPIIELADLERQELQRLVKRHLTPQQLVLRARIVLAAAYTGANNHQIARQLEGSVDMVRRWRGGGGAFGGASVEGVPGEGGLRAAPRAGESR